MRVRKGGRGTSNSNVRGSSYDRAVRKRWLLKKSARCYRCKRALTLRTVTVDRIIPGAHGGTYRRENIRPACSLCNSETGAVVRRK